MEELSTCDGSEGRPTYIVFKNRVVDVSNSTLWKGGEHMARHRAGKDLTEEFKNAPHGADVFDRYPQAGVLQKGTAPDEQESKKEARIPGTLVRILNRFPILKRHPHPFLVHFPIVFMCSTTAFTIIYLITGNKSFETTALHCLGGGTLFAVAAILSGLFTWWINYGAETIKPVIEKIILSPILFIIGLVAFVWRLMNPHILDHIDGLSVVFLFLILSLAPLALLIGLIGGMLTFPIHSE